MERRSEVRQRGVEHLDERSGADHRRVLPRGRCGPAAASGLRIGLGRAYPHGGAGGGDDHGQHQHLSLEILRRGESHPKTATAIMLGTVIVTVATHDLAKGVLTGVVLTALSFTRRVSAMLKVGDFDREDGVRAYVVP
jgi:hypothetical protein